MSQLIAHTTGALLFRQIAAATRRTLPLKDLLEILTKDPEMFGKDTSAVEALAQQLRQGDSLSAALRRLPELVSPETAELVRAGETQGMLAPILDAIADDHTGAAKGRGAIQGALVWPKAVASLAFLILAMLMTFVVPEFKQLFNSFGGSLPAPTLALVSISDAFVAWWWLLAAAIVVFIVLKRRNKLPVGFTVAVEKLLLAVPFVRVSIVSSFAERLTCWLRSTHGNPQVLAAAMRHLSATAGMSPLALCAARLEARLSDGVALGQALYDLAPVPKRLALLVQFGEKTGDLEAALGQAADFAAADAEAALARFERGLMVSLYLLLGLAIGYIVIGMYLPIFKMGAAV